MNKAIKRITAALLGAIQVVGAISFGTAASAAVPKISPDTIAAGDNHSLIIKSDKTLWAAGDNSRGQLGLGDEVTESNGQKVMSDIVFVDANENTSFAIDSKGVLYGWGDNSDGQITNTGSNLVISKPLKIMENVVAVSAGDDHTIALTADGSAYGWGNNSHGELGYASNKLKNGAKLIRKDIVDIAAGDDFTMLVTKSGELLSFGNNANGQLGMKSSVDKKELPVLVLDSGVSAVEAGDSHALIIKTDGTVWATGLNDEGQLGTGTDKNYNYFVSVGIKNAAAVFADEKSSAAVTADGKLYTWGRNHAGQLHNGNKTGVKKPASVTSGCVSIAFGEGHSIMLKENGNVSAAGIGLQGQLFYNTVSAELKPVKIKTNVEVYAAGNDHAAMIDDKGILYTWGNNDCGQLGVGDYVVRNVPTKVKLPEDAVNVWCGNKTTYVLTESDRVYVFGDNSNGLLGINSKTKTVCEPMSNFDLSDYKSIEIYPSDNFCLAIMNGDVYGWGVNTAARLLDCPANVKYPTIISDSLRNIRKLAVGSNHCLALDSTGCVWVWGANSAGQLSNQSSTSVIDQPEMLEIYNNKDELMESSFRDIAAAENHTLLIGVDDKVWAMGLNEYGQLGTEITRLKPPTWVTKDVEMIIAGTKTCAVVYETGKMSVSGDNNCGGLGDGTIKNRSQFVTTTASNVAAADLGDGFGGYINYGKELWCWGSNSLGQVGNGRGGAISTPEYVFKGALLSKIRQAESIKLDKTQLVVKPKGTARITATVTPADAVMSQVTWSSSNTKVATVNSTGLVKGVAKGTAVITAATANGLKATCEVTVNIPVSRFTVSPSKSKTLKIGGSFTFTTKVYPDNAADKTLLFESSDPDVATVSSTGKVKAVSCGKTVITITAKGNPAKKKTVTVTVKPNTPKVNSCKATSDGVIIKWSEVNGADGYEVYRKLSGESTSKAIADISDASSFIDTTAKTGKKYIYSIKAYTVYNGKKIYSSRSTQYKLTAK